MQESKDGHNLTHPDSSFTPAPQGSMDQVVPCVDSPLERKTANLWENIRTSRFRHALEVRYDFQSQKLQTSERMLCSKVIFSLYLDMVENGQEELARDLLNIYRLK